MGLYSMMKGAAQYTVLTVALMGGVVAGSYGKPAEVRPIRQPREPCSRELYANDPKYQQPVNVPEKVAYAGLAALAVAALATVMRRKHDAHLENLQPRRWHAENFFGNDDLSER